MAQPRMYGDIEIFSGTGSVELARKIADYLHVPLSPREIVTFPNENIFVRLQTSVRGQDVFIIQTTSSPVNYNIMELLLLLDTVKRASAGRITAVDSRTLLMAAAIRRISRACRSRRGCWPTSSPSPGPTATCWWICTPGKFRVSLASPATS